MLVLTLNCGSSSAKFQIYDWEGQTVMLAGTVERIAHADTTLQMYVKDKDEYRSRRSCKDHTQAIEWVLEELSRSGIELNEIRTVGHRMLHGGEAFIKSTIIGEQTLKVFESLASLGPLHMPANIKGVKAAKEALPDAAHCAIMDTAWHQTIPARAFMYAIPYEWYKQFQIRRYGFHGTSYLYTAKRAAALLGKEALKTNLIIAHIGNGASMCAVQNGVCVDTSMGLTPLEGLVMGTRSGDIDPAIIPFMMERLQCTPKEIDNYLNKVSGVFGITGGTTDRRDVYKKCCEGDERARLAFEMECYQIRKRIGSYMAILGRLDALVFTAGVGEMSPEYRGGMLENLDIMGIQLDPEKNAISHSRNCETRISKDDSPVPVFVIPTDEELVMTEDAVALIHGSYDVHTRFSYRFASSTYRNLSREARLNAELEANPQLESIIARPPASE